MRVFRTWGAPAVFARSSYNLKEATIQYLKAIYFSIKTALIVGGYRLPPTGYKNNLQNNVNLLILEFHIFFKSYFCVYLGRQSILYFPICLFLEPIYLEFVQTVNDIFIRQKRQKNAQSLDLKWLQYHGCPNRVFNPLGRTSQCALRPVSWSRDQILWMRPACSGWMVVLPHIHWCFCMRES